MKFLTAVLGIALVVAGGAAIHFWREADAGRVQIAALRAQLQEQAAQPTMSPATPAMPSLPAPIAAAAAPAAPRPDVATAQDQTQAAAAFMDRVEAQMESPEGAARRRMLSRTMIETSFPDIGEALGLKPDEASKLLDLLAAQQDSTSAVFREARSGATSIEERMAAVQERQQAQEAELRTMLGNKYSQYQDYRQSLGAWQQRRDLRAVLDAGGIPMTDAQSRSLIAALSAEYRNVTEEARAAAAVAAGQGRPVGDIIRAQHSPERRQRMLDAAAPHLSPQQLEGYRGMLERAAAQEQSMLAPLRAREAAAAAAAGAAAPR